MRSRLENHVGSGVRLGTTGVEFDPRLISLGSSAGVRFAGAAHFPRQIPVPEGEKLLDWQVDRLGALPPHHGTARIAARCTPLYCPLHEVCLECYESKEMVFSTRLT